jgi:hypothetical protein
MLRPVRRIVTGHNSDGRSVVVSDEFSPHTKAERLTDLWRTYTAPASNEDDSDQAATAVELKPPANGTVCRYFQIKPESEYQEQNIEQRQQEAAQLFEAMGASGERDASAKHQNMHKTDSVDYIILLSGEVTMKPLDVVIQRGTNHAWINNGSEPAVLAAILIDARPI